MATAIERSLDLATKPIVWLPALHERRRRKQHDKMRARLDMRERHAFEFAIADVEKIEHHVMATPFQMLEDRNGPRPVAAPIAQENRLPGVFHRSKARKVRMVHSVAPTMDRALSHAH
nr:hypothetical protein [Caballeronia arationis]